MGRFYRTSVATPIDYMSQLNVPLMEQVLQANDQGIATTLDSAEKTNQAAYFDYAPQDEDAAQQIIKGYNDKVNNITDAIRSNYVNWRSQQGAIRNLANQLANDYRGGNISKYVANATARKAYFDAADAQAKLWNESGGTKGQSPDVVQAFKNRWDSDFTGTNLDPNTGSYNTYRGGAVPTYMDIPKLMADGLDKIKANKNLQYKEGPDGRGYIIGQEGDYEAITPETIIAAAMGNITPQVTNYLHQMADVGLIDPKTITNPYSTVPDTSYTADDYANINFLKDKLSKAKDGEAKAGIYNQIRALTDQINSRTKGVWDENSYFTPILRKLINDYSNTSITNKTTVKPDSTWSTVFTQGQENARSARTLAQQWAIHEDTKQAAANKLKQDNDHWQKEQEEKHWEFMNPQAKPGTTGTKAGVVPNTVAKPSSATTSTPMPKETGVSDLTTDGFNGWKSTDGQNPVLSNAGLSSDIDYYKGQISQVQQQLNDATSIADKTKLQQTLNYLNNELNDRRSFYKLGMDAVMSGNPRAGTPITQEQKSVYDEFTNDRDASKMISQAHTMMAEAQNEAASSVLAKVAGTDEYKNATPAQRQVMINNSIAAQTASHTKFTQAQSMLDKAQNYLKIKRQVDANRDTYYQNMREGNYITTKAITPNDKDSKDVANMILSNPSGVQIYDDYGNNTSGFQVGTGRTSLMYPTATKGSNANNETLTFGGGALQDYMDRNGVTMNVTKIGNSTKLGSGDGVAEVTFNDPNGNLSGKKFYLALTPELQRKIGAKFESSNAIGVADVANNMTDENSNYIRKQFIRASTNKINGVYNKEEPNTYNITVPTRSGAIANLTVHTITDGNENSYYITYKDASGKDQPVPRVVVDPKTLQVVQDPNTSTWGHFQNKEDFINQRNLQTNL